MNRTTVDKLTQNEAFDPVEAQAALASVERGKGEQTEPATLPDEADRVDAMMDYVERETAHVDPYPWSESQTE
jgi:hypothetical protein